MRLPLRLIAAAIGVAIVGAPAALAAPAAVAAEPEVVNLYNIATGKCADLPGFGKGSANTRVNQYDCDYDGSDNQRWRLLPYGSQQGEPIYLIQNGKDRLCLDLPGFGVVKPGTAVSEYKCLASGDNQKFVVRKVTRGVSQLVNVASGLCLDVAGVRTGGNNALLTLFNCSRTDDHLWSLPANSSGQVSDAFAQAYVRGFTDYPGKDRDSDAILTTVPATGHDGLLVARWFIPNRTAARILHGDNRGYRSDPWASSKAVLTWDLRTGQARVLATASVFEFGGGPERIPALPFQQVSPAELTTRHDTRGATHNRFSAETWSQGHAGTTRWRDASLTFGISASNSYTVNRAPQIIENLGPYTIDGILKLSPSWDRTDEPKIDVHFEGNSFPALEVHYYPREQKAPRIIAHRNISPRAVGTNKLFPEGGMGLRDVLSWGICDLNVDRLSMTCNETGAWKKDRPSWTTSW